MLNNDRKAVAAVLLSRGIKGVDLAKIVSVTPETISRWRREEGFQTLINVLRMEILNEARDRLRSKSSQAVEVLAELMENTKSDALKLKAASEILRLANVHDPRYYMCGLQFGETLPESEWRDFGV